jgi:hypothetical protein
VEKEELMAELRDAGIKHNPEAILRIEKSPRDGKIIFLEMILTQAGNTFWRNIKPILSIG